MIAWLRARSRWTKFAILMVAAWVPFVLALVGHAFIGMAVFVLAAATFFIAVPVPPRDRTPPAANDPN